jgi:hypothetical protein
LNGIRLSLGGGKNENRAPMKVTEDSLNKALSPDKIDPSCYKVYYRNEPGEVAPKWPKGDLTDLDTSDISVPKEIGGAMNDQGGGTPSSMKPATRSTQLVTFQTVDDLKTFVNTLQSSTRTPTPTPHQ